MSNFNRKMFFKVFFMLLFFSLAAGIVLAGLFLRGNNLESILFYARVPMSDGSTQAVNNCLEFCVPIAISIFVVFNLISFLFILHKDTILKFKDRKVIRTVLNFIRMLYRHMVLSSVIVVVASVIFFGTQINAFSYIGSVMKTTTVYDDEYTPPQEQEFIFPKTKKNLIYIFLESLETSYASVEEGGLMDENYIPYLTELAKENISFSDKDYLGGAHSAAGTTWTAAAMVTQTAGIPLTIPISKSNFGNNDQFLPGAYSLGEILEEAGYNQMLMVGSKASYAKRKDYFVQHGNYEIFDYYTAIEKGYLPEDYYVWWGFEDQKLFEYAKTEIENLAAKDEPFNFTMLTVDTHFTDGYKCELCENNFDTQYANVISCSDRQVYEFVKWIQESDFYKNEETVIVIAGDHLTMDHNYFNRIDDSVKARGRRIYNCFINSGLSDKYTTNRVFTTLDMYPTTLAALGVTWGKESLGLGVNLFSGKPTLAERKGIEKFSAELASSSNFYGDYIIDKNLEYDGLKDKYEDDVGPSGDLLYTQTEDAD